MSKFFSTLSSAAELENYLIGLYAGAAQYDFPPSYPGEQFCGGVDGAKQGTGILGKIFAGLVALTGNQTCYVNQASNSPSVSNVSSDGWSWQACSEMVIPRSIDSKDTMFPQGLYGPFNFTQQSLYCESVYGVPSRPNWVTTYYGGYDIKLVLRRFGSNIIFSNGLRDPYSSGGVLENLSNTLLAVYTTQGCHCLDILSASESDPQWLINQRKVEVKIIDRWLKTYYADLRALG